MIDIKLLPTNIDGISVQYLTKEEAKERGIHKDFSDFGWEIAAAVFSLNNEELRTGWGWWKGLDKRLNQDEAVQAIQEVVATAQRQTEERKNREVVDNSRKPTRYPSGSVGWARDEEYHEW
jgi:hypothetical protein